MEPSRRVVISNERCKQCQYRMNISGGDLIPRKKAYGMGIVACGYILKEGHSRVFENGRHRSDYEEGYCNYYIPGKRIKSFDDPLNKDGCNNTLKKGRKKNGTEESVH